MDKLERESTLTREWKLVTTVRDVECFFSGEVIPKGYDAIRANANKGDGVGKGSIYAWEEYRSKIMHKRKMREITDTGVGTYKVNTKKNNEPDLTNDKSDLPEDYGFSQHIIELQKPLTWWQKLLNLFS